MMAFPSLTYTREELQSPGAAVARQARLDTAMTTMMDGIARTFLAEMLPLAVSQGRYLYAADAWSLWSQIVDRRVGAAPAAVAAWVAPILAESDVPDVALDSITTVLTMAANQGWTDAQTVGQLRLALAPDAGETTAALVAAAGPRNGARWADLDAGGMSFMDRMKRDARTAVTGLDGMMATAAMAEQGFTRKRWVTRHDNKVRDTHRQADGDTLPLSEAFIVGGYPLQYPGDRSGPPGEVINCRCTLVGTRWRGTGAAAHGRIR